MTVIKPIAKSCPPYGINHAFAAGALFIHDVAIIAIALGVIVAIVALVYVVNGRRAYLSYLPTVGFRIALVLVIAGLLALFLVVPNIDTCPLK